MYTTHITYNLAYRLVWCSKYRKKILVGRLASFLERAIRRLCEVHTWAIGALPAQEDHVYLFLSAAPRIPSSRDGIAP
jgi:putative transposase